MTDQVQVQVENRVMAIRMNRPEKKNALTGAMYNAMRDALRKAGGNPQVRAVLLTGTQDCFTAGNDLADFAAAKPGEPVPALTFLEVLTATPKPVVAAVAGVAVGIGTTMLLHCDLVYAAKSARFQLPFVNLGLCPEAASSMILPAMAGSHRASELLMLGEPFGADVGREIGLVNQVVDDAELFAAAAAKAQALAEKPPAAMRATKALIKGSVSAAIAEAMKRESAQFGALLQGPEAKEAMAAFMERRKPDWSKF
ncbi:MAG TPA: enoyl-CoA hydratase [Candidatus Limnocylindrales bacterium]|nr:enoyl-CoA hydratase [Candidatus Limnocylindrales bacterium]